MPTAGDPYEIAESVRWNWWSSSRRTRCRLPRSVSLLGGVGSKAFSSEGGSKIMILRWDGVVGQRALRAARALA
jgi:hypothetical protein